MKNSIGYNASIGLHSTNHRVATPIYVGKASFYFSKATINATPRHNLTNKFAILRSVCSLFYNPASLKHNTQKRLIILTYKTTYYNGDKSL